MQDQNKTSLQQYTWGIIETSTNKIIVGWTTQETPLFLDTCTYKPCMWRVIPLSQMSERESNEQLVTLKSELTPCLRGPYPHVHEDLDHNHLCRNLLGIHPAAATLSSLRSHHSDCNCLQERSRTKHMAITW